MRKISKPILNFEAREVGFLIRINIILYTNLSTKFCIYFVLFFCNVRNFKTYFWKVLAINHVWKTLSLIFKISVRSFVEEVMLIRIKKKNRSFSFKTKGRVSSENSLNFGKLRSITINFEILRKGTLRG